MNALDVVSIYVVTNRAPYLKCDLSVSIYVAVAFTPNHPTDPYLREGLSQTMLLVTRESNLTQVADRSDQRLLQTRHRPQWLHEVPWARSL